MKQRWMSLWNSQTFSVIQRMLAVYSLVPLPFLNLVDICNFLVQIMLKLSMKDFKYDLTSMGDECNCLMVSTFFSTTVLGNWHKDWPFTILWPLLGLPDLLTPCTTLMGSSFRVLNSCTVIVSHPLALYSSAPKAHWTLLFRLCGSGWLTTPL